METKESSHRIQVLGSVPREDGGCERWSRQDSRRLDKWSETSAVMCDGKLSR